MIFYSKAFHGRGDELLFAADEIQVVNVLIGRDLGLVDGAARGVPPDTDLIAGSHLTGTL
jgi:hypothetical protein